MKKMFLALAVVAFGLTLSLTACNEEKPTQEQPKAPATQTAKPATTSTAKPVASPTTKAAPGAPVASPAAKK